MARALLLGNSHVAAYKLASEQLAGSTSHRFSIFCARGADLAFTEIRNAHIVPISTKVLDIQEVNFFFPDSRSAARRYTERGTPIADVAQQFTLTGGAPTISLEDVAAIFYVVGTSPCDFKRLGEPVAPYTEACRRELLSRLLDVKFPLRDHIRNLRASMPNIRHYYVGAPLKKIRGMKLEPDELRMIELNRSLTSRLARNFLFDDVFIPDADLLSKNLMSTKAKFFSDGRPVAQEFQGVKRTHKDDLHVGSEYAHRVFHKFILPRMAELNSESRLAC